MGPSEIDGALSREAAMAAPTRIVTAKIAKNKTTSAYSKTLPSDSGSIDRRALTDSLVVE